MPPEWSPKWSQKQIKFDTESHPTTILPKRTNETAKINTFLSPLSYISVQTVEAKRLFSYFHLSCNKLAQETEKRPKMHPKWKQNGAKMGSKSIKKNDVKKSMKNNRFFNDFGSIWGAK